MSIRSEEDFLRLVDKHFANPPGMAGRGDDCAVIPGGPERCMTTDLFLEDFHFRRSYFSPEDTGWKSLAVNISDVASMGAVPEGFLLSLIIPPDLPDDYWDRFFSGMAELANAHDIALVGGDLSAGPGLGISVTAWGRPGPFGGFVPRTGAQPGDRIFICGEYGLARGGLLALEAAKADASGKAREEALNKYPSACRALLRPSPKVAEGMALGRAGVRCMMDLSDGPARDLPRLLDGMGAALEIDPEHLSSELLDICEEQALSPVEVAFAGGDDYALLGAMPPRHFDQAMERIPGMTPLGTVQSSGPVLVNRRPWSQTGFDHFQK